MRPPAENEIADLVVREALTSPSSLARGPTALPGCWRGVEIHRVKNEAAGDFVVREAPEIQSSLAHRSTKLPGCWRGVENHWEGNDVVGDFIVREAPESRSSSAHGPARLPGCWRGVGNHRAGNETAGGGRPEPYTPCLRSMPEESEQVAKATPLLVDFVAREAPESRSSFAHRPAKLPGCWLGVENHRGGNEAAGGRRSEPRPPRLRSMPKELERVMRATRLLADFVAREAPESRSSSARGPAELPGCWRGVENCRAGNEAAGGGRLEPFPPRLQLTPTESEQVTKARSGFKTVAFHAPLCKNTIALLNDAVPKIAARAPSLRVNFLCTPASERSVRGLVRIAFDGTDETEVERADRLLRRCEATLELMGLPIIRYGASTNANHESSCNVLRSKL